MNLQNLQWKIRLDASSPGDAREWFRAFGAWIPESPERFVDVAEYGHVQDGPVIYLSGYLECYALDASGGCLGLLYDRRQPTEGTNAEKLSASLRGLLERAARLEADPSFATPPRFLAGELDFRVNNRAVSPNTEATLAKLRPLLDELLAKVYGAGGYALERDPDPKRRFSVRILAKEPVSTAEARKRLG